MSKADQMFEELGYEKSEYKDSNLEDIFYRKKDRQWREDGEIEICINNNEQQITIEFMCSSQLPAFIGMKEIEAIHEKIKELRMGGRRMKGKRFKKGERVMPEKVDVDKLKKAREEFSNRPQGLLIDGIPAEDYGTPNSRTTYPGEIDIGETLKSNLEYWRERCFELQDEIEGLKKKTKKCEYYEMVADELFKEIEQLKKPKYLYNAHTGEIIKLDNSNYISKDKIKAKIEEVKDGTYDAKIVLQSLLEEE